VHRVLVGWRTALNDGGGEVGHEAG
jgi:hypothetical protein